MKETCRMIPLITFILAGLGAAALYAIDAHLPWIFAASMAAAPGFFMVEIERNCSEAVAN